MDSALQQNSRDVEKKKTKGYQSMIKGVLICTNCLCIQPIRNVGFINTAVIQ